MFFNLFAHAVKGKTVKNTFRLFSERDEMFRMSA